MKVKMDWVCLIAMEAKEQVGSWTPKSKKMRVCDSEASQILKVIISLATGHVETLFSSLFSILLLSMASVETTTSIQTVRPIENQVSPQSCQKGFGGR